MYKCAIIGVSGSRAHGHAEAYQHIKRGKLSAISTRNRENLDSFADKFQVSARYTDYREMFERERPDLVHVNTPPDVRLEVFRAANAAGIPALFVEKPLAIDVQDYLAIQDFAKDCQVKIAINHQLHFHPRRLALQKLVQDGKIGEIRFIDTSARMNLAYQGTHALQAVNGFNPQGAPIDVFGQVSGIKGLLPNRGQHFSPDQCVAQISFDNGIDTLLRCGTSAPSMGDERVSQHVRVAVYGTDGYIHWTMRSWELNHNGRTDSGAHIYAEENILGQALATEAMFDWLSDEKISHPLNLSHSLRDFNVILSIYMGALEHRVIALPSSPKQNLLASLRQRLSTE